MTSYDSEWLYEGLRRAMHAADHDDFPLVNEVCHATFEYLENFAPLQLMPIESLISKMRKLLEQIGFGVIAEELRPFAPPIQICLRRLVEESGCAMEMLLFSLLRKEMDDLGHAGATEVRLLHVRDCVMHVRGARQWDRGCQRLLTELCGFLRGFDEQVQTTTKEASVVLHLDGVR